MTSKDYGKQILTYQIASREMRYEIENERTVYLQGGPETGFILYGKIPDAADVSSVNLAQVLLEFAMSWQAPPGDQSEAWRHLEHFGRHIGEALADQIEQTMPVSSVLQRAAHALEDIFRSLDAPIANQQETENELRYELDQCPLHLAAEVGGMSREARPAHHALNAMFQGLVAAIDPGLRVQLTDRPNARPVIRLLAPTIEAL
jgi:hypothetical protein